MSDGLNSITLRGVIGTSTPVFGFRPIRSLNLTTPGGKSVTQTAHGWTAHGWELRLTGPEG
jgi:hypothetical protein